MTGLLLLAGGLAWFSVAILLAIWLAGRFNNFLISSLVGLAALAVLLPLPVIDEIVGERQFNALCATGAELQIDAQRIKGRKIRLAFEPSNAAVGGTAIPVTHTRVIFRDASSDEQLGSYGRYTAKGGWLIRALGISNSDSPLWMSRKSCSPPMGSRQMANRYAFEIIN